jgi:hypothetical protein
VGLGVKSNRTSRAKKLVERTSKTGTGRLLKIPTVT